jgi:hypothetical protein
MGFALGGARNWSVSISRRRSDLRQALHGHGDLNERSIRFIAIFS